MSLDKYPVINPATLSMLRKSTAANPDYLKELFQSFIDDSNELFDEIRMAAENDNFDSYYSSVHTLKGLCGTIGCSRMFEVLKMMDSLNKDKEFNESKKHLDGLGEAIDRTAAGIKKDIFSD